MPRLEHVAIVVDENQPYSNVVGNSAMPYLNGLIQQYGLATNYYADGHFSLPNYFVLTTGEQITHDDGFTCAATVDNIVRQLLPAGKTWKVYAESLPSVGYTGGDQYPYQKHHNPFAYISDVKDTTQKSNIVPLTQLSADIANNALPNYIFIVPNDQSNSHDCPPGMSSCTNNQKLQYADSWLQSNIAPLITSPAFQASGVLFLTWDESLATDTVNGGGHVATVVVGTQVQPGYRSSTLYQHDNILRSALEALGITQYFGGARYASNMAEFFGSTGGNPGSISGVVSNASTGSGIANASVSYYGGSTTCDANGNYTLSNVPAGSVTVTAGATGYQSSSQTLTVTAGANSAQNFQLTQLSTGGIVGRVTNISNGAAVASVTVTAGGATTLTDTSGNYTLANLPVGNYSVTATKSGWGTQTRTASVTAGANTTVNFQLATSGVIKGTLTDASGALIAGATVNITGGVIATNKNVTSSSTGVYSSGWIPVGSYTVTVTKSGYTTQQKTASVTTGATTTLNFTLQ
ncbi:MAG TPA: carboxypeptidase regulatory-like domain-containing protein [Terriglobales bacterium]|nr:carboxypeptidase regulatory-like domain-containing protein [Terriglobales bacterium]